MPVSILSPTSGNSLFPPHLKPWPVRRPSIETKSAIEAGAVGGRDTLVSHALDRPKPHDAVSVRTRCRIVRQLTAEMVRLVGERVPLRRDRRRSECHIRQISMYVCHVALQISLTDIGLVYGRDRTTVGHACNVVEDRRDDAAYDEFVAAIERVVAVVFGDDAHG